MRHRTHPGMAAEARRIMERHSARRPEQLGQLVFGFDRPKSFPAVPSRSRSEQTVLPVRGTIQERYEAWRPTENGEAVFRSMARRAMALAKGGQSRIGPKSLAERTRDDLHIEINNDFVALLAREIVEKHPDLKPLIPLRERRAT